MALVSSRQYARMRGVSHTAIHRAVVAGKIPLFSGKIDPDVPNEWEAAHDAAAADAAARLAEARLAETGRGQDVAAAAPVGGELEGGRLAAVADLAEETRPGTKADSERRKEFVKAEIAEIELRKLRGELVEVADVQRALGTMITKVQTRLLLVPSLVAVKVAVTADAIQCERMIDVEIRSALMELSQYPAGIEDEDSRRRVKS